MSFKTALLLTSVAVLICSISASPLEFCTNSQYILAGEHLNWSINVTELMCTVDGRQLNDGSMLFSTPGSYQYSCRNMSGNLSVVAIQHKLAFCLNCTPNYLVIFAGQAVSWTGPHWECSLQLVNNSCHGNVLREFSSQTLGLQQIHHFQEPGTYQFLCRDNCEPLATVTVVNANDTKLEEFCSQPQPLIDDVKYKELIYSHGAIMAVTFGILFPLGAFLASIKKPIAHMILQPLGIVLAVIGFVLATVYKGLNGSTHFNQLHSIIGLLLLAVVIIIIPGLKLSLLAPIKEKWQRLVIIWHKRLGISAVFFGFSNVFLGLLVLSDTPVYIKVIYGVWVLICIAVFVISGSVTKQDVYDDDEALSVMVTCCHYRADKVTLNRQDPVRLSKLSKDVLSEGKYIQARKKSMDMLEMAVEPVKTLPQRKISNVHFGPVDIAANLTPNIVTPQSANQFGFTNRLSSEELSDDSESDQEQSTDEVDAEINDKKNVRDSQFSINSIPSDGGSIRITRHSDRAHTKVTDLFQRCNSISQNPSPLMTSQHVKVDDNNEGDNEKHKKEGSSSSEDMTKCPFHRSGNSDSDLPLQQRRMRKNAFASTENPPPMTLPGQQKIKRQISRNSSFRRQQQKKLIDNTLQSVMEISDDAIICANAQGEIVFWSAGAMKMFGYTPGEAIGSSLQMIMPERYKEKHQNGVNGRTERALDYIRKHHTAPEEQKHARLYAVHGVSKTGKEFGVEAVVTSFVIEEDIYYTGIISEVKPLTRQQSSCSLSSETEIREKHQKAMAIGAQMKIVHKLRNADYMTKRELTRILQNSLQAAEFEVPPEDITVMVDTISKAADKDESGVIKFVDLIDLLGKHQLYISDSGLIAKYGKAKASEGNLRPRERCCNKVFTFLFSRIITLSWVLAYIILNIILWVIGVLTEKRKGWSKVSYGTGPVLSMNCVLILLPMMYSLIHIFRGSSFLTKILPLKHSFLFHIIIAIGIIFWSAVHITTHLCSFSFDNINENGTYHDNFTTNIKTHLMPLITGICAIFIIIILIVSSIKPLRSLCQFIGFYSLHWVGIVLFYILLVLHGTNYYNPSFWKWLLPVLFVYLLERLYHCCVVTKYSVALQRAAPYDELSRTTKVEVNKPKHYKFIPGQYLLINIPQIGYFNWQPCKIASTNKEKALTLYVPHIGNAWIEKVFQTFRSNPIKPTADGQTIPVLTVNITKPYGVGASVVFDYKVAILVCGGDGPLTCRSIIQTFLEYRKGSSCHCGCHPNLTKLYFVWVTPSGNDYEWFTDYLSELTEDENLKKYLDIRIFLTNINSPPDELASALLHLALKTGGPALSVRRPSQPQLSKLYAYTSYGIPDFENLLDFVSMQQGTASDQGMECGVFTAGDLPQTVKKDLLHYCAICSKKKGPPITNTPADSPYKQPVDSSSELEQVPREWHITFTQQTLIL